MQPSLSVLVCYKGVYSVVVTGKIVTSYGIYTGQSTFKLTVDFDCKTAPDVVTITATTIPSMSVIA